MNAGTASLGQAGPELVAFNFPGYAKQGDALTITFDKASRACARSTSRHGWKNPRSPRRCGWSCSRCPTDQLPGSIVLSIREQDRSAHHEVELPETGDVVTRRRDDRAKGTSAYAVPPGGTSVGPGSRYVRRASPLRHGPSAAAQTNLQLWGDVSLNWLRSDAWHTPSISSRRRSWRHRRDATGW